MVLPLYKLDVKSAFLQGDLYRMSVKIAIILLQNINFTIVCPNSFELLVKASTGHSTQHQRPTTSRLHGKNLALVLGLSFILEVESEWGQSIQ